MTDSLAIPILEALPHGIVALDLSERVLFANAAAGTILGRTPEQLTGAPLFHQPLRLTDLTALEDAYRRVVRDGETGDPVFGSVTSDAGRMSIRARPIRASGEGDVAGVLVLETLPAIGGSDNAADDLERCLDVVRRVRHDVNNPLMGIYGNVELLLSGESLSPTARDKVGAIREDAVRIRDRIVDLGELRRKGG